MATMYKLVGFKTLAFPNRTNVFDSRAHYTKEQVGEYLTRKNATGQSYFEEVEAPDESVQSIAPKGPVSAGSPDLTSADVAPDSQPKKITIGGKTPSKNSIEV